MKALRVICIILLVIGILVTLLFSAFKPTVQKEIDSLKDLKSDSKETEVLKSKVKYENEQILIEFADLKSNAEKKWFTTDEYSEQMDKLKEIGGDATVFCGVFDGLMLIGIVCTTVVISKKKSASMG